MCKMVKIHDLITCDANIQHNNFVQTLQNFVLSHNHMTVIFRSSELMHIMFELFMLEKKVHWTVLTQGQPDP